MSPTAFAQALGQFAQLDGLCAQTDPDAFFPEKGETTHAAKRICDLCDVKDACLNFALETDERYGVWGGLGERERRALKARRITP